MNQRQLQPIVAKFQEAFLNQEMTLDDRALPDRVRGLWRQRRFYLEMTATRSGFEARFRIDELGCLLDEPGGTSDWVFIPPPTEFKVQQDTKVFAFVFPGNENIDREIRSTVRAIKVALHTCGMAWIDDQPGTAACCSDCSVQFTCLARKDQP